MATVKELKEWLNRFPEETIVEVGIKRDCGDYDTYDFKTPILDDGDKGIGWEFTDFKNNKWVNEDSPHFGKCYLQFGE